MYLNCNSGDWKDLFIIDPIALGVGKLVEIIIELVLIQN